MDLEVPSEQAMCYVDKESHNGKMSGDSVNAKPFTPSTSPNGVIDYSFASGRSSSYSSSNAASTVGAVDMEQLKASVLAAEAGTGEVAKVIQGACFTPRHNAFTTLLQLASKARQPEKAIEIFEAMQAHSGIAPNKFTYSALISAQARVGKWEQAEKYFNEMREKAKTDPTLLPNTVTYAALISAYEKGRQLDKALVAFQDQLLMGVEPDVITYASLLSACERAGNVEKAVDMLDAMHAQGLVGPQQMYNGVIAACGRQWPQALEAFLGMQCAGVPVSVQTVNLLMASFCSGGEKDHALWLLRQMASVGLPLSLTNYISLLQILSTNGDYKAADAVYSMMQEAKQPPDASAASLIISAHTTGGDFAGADVLSRLFGKCIGYASLNQYINVNSKIGEEKMGSEDVSGVAVRSS